MCAAKKKEGRGKVVGMEMPVGITADITYHTTLALYNRSVVQGIRPIPTRSTWTGRLSYRQDNFSVHGNVRPMMPRCFPGATRSGELHDYVLPYTFLVSACERYTLAAQCSLKTFPFSLSLSFPRPSSEDK